MKVDSDRFHKFQSKFSSANIDWIVNIEKFRNQISIKHGFESNEFKRHKKIIDIISVTSYQV